MSEPIRFHCHGCSKPVSSPLPPDSILRAIAWCPECIETGRDQLARFTREDVEVLRLIGDDRWLQTLKVGRRVIGNAGDLVHSIADRIDESLPPAEHGELGAKNL